LLIVIDAQGTYIAFLEKKAIFIFFYGSLNQLFSYISPPKKIGEGRQYASSNLLETFPQMDSEKYLTIFY